MSGMLQKVPCDEITLGAMYSAPVFFDDGENMFLAPNKTAKEYHLAVIKRWKVPFLLSAGHKLSLDEISALSQKGAFLAHKEQASVPQVDEEFAELDAADDIGDLEELSDFEDL